MTSSNTECTEVNDPMFALAGSISKSILTSFDPACIGTNVGRVIQSKSTFEWTIKNFSDYCETVGDYICSPAFSQDKEFSWRLELYPYGRNEKSNGFLSLFLGSGTIVNFQTLFVLSVINMHNPATIKKIKHTSTADESDEGFCRFIDRNVVTKNIKHLDDVLTITCEILSANMINYFCNSQICDKRLITHDDFGQLYINKNLSDIILKVDAKEFPVHKDVLSARSEVFAAMFQHDTVQKGKNVVEIKDISNGIMDTMLKFIYTDEVKNIKETAKDLLVAADKYAIKDLKDICIIELGQTINVDNAIDLLLYAERHNFDELKTNIIDYIANNAKETVGEPLLKLARNAPWEIISDLFSKLALMTKYDNI